MGSLRLTTIVLLLVGWSTADHAGKFASQIDGCYPFPTAAVDPNADEIEGATFPLSSECIQEVASGSSEFFLQMVFPSMAAKGSNEAFFKPAFWDASEGCVEKRRKLGADSATARRLCATQVVWGAQRLRFFGAFKYAFANLFGVKCSQIFASGQSRYSMGSYKPNQWDADAVKFENTEMTYMLGVFATDLAEMVRIEEITNSWTSVETMKASFETAYAAAKTKSSCAEYDYDLFDFKRPAIVTPKISATPMTDDEASNLICVTSGSSYGALDFGDEASPNLAWATKERDECVDPIRAAAATAATALSDSSRRERRRLSAGLAATNIQSVYLKLSTPMVLTPETYDDVTSTVATIAGVASNRVDVSSASMVSGAPPLYTITISYGVTEKAFAKCAAIEEAFGSRTAAGSTLGTAVDDVSVEKTRADCGGAAAPSMPLPPSTPVSAGRTRTARGFNAALLAALLAVVAAGLVYV